MQRESWSNRLGRVLGKEGIDLERLATHAGRKVGVGWNWIAEKAKAISSLPTHEDRLRKMEADTAEIARDVRDLKAWVKDVDNRTKLLEHFNNYDVDDVACPVCGSVMRVKRNRRDGSFFFGCSKWGHTGCQGTRPIADPYLDQLAKRYFAA